MFLIYKCKIGITNKDLITSYQCILIAIQIYREEDNGIKRKG